MSDNWQLKAVLSAVDKMSPVLKQVGTVAKGTRKYLSDVASSAGALTGKIGLPLTMLSGILGGFSLGAIKNAVVGFTEMGEAAYKGSLRSGMIVEEWQKMKYVADQAGVPIEALEGSMAKLNAQTAKAAAGQNKNLSGLYARLGISVRDSNGQIRSAVDLLPQLADAFQKNKNPAVQARMGVTLFGKSWAEMAPLLMEGSEGINNSLERFKRLKGVMSFDDIKGAKELGDKFKDLSFVTKGFQNTIAKELVPVLGPLVDDIVMWAAANRKVVSAGVKEFVRDLVEGIKAVDWSGIINGTREFFKSLKDVVDMVGGTKNALIILAVVMNLQTIAAAIGLAASIGRLGLFLVGLAGQALAPVAPLQLLQAELVAANMKGAALVGTFGKLAAGIGVVAAAWAGWEVGKLLNEHVINPAVQKLTGDKDASLGTWIYDKLHPEESQRPSLVAPKQKAEVGGKITFDFQNAPPGMRLVDQQATGGPAFDVNMGYRSLATGMP